MAWYALYCASRSELSVCEALIAAGLDAFCPSRVVKRRQRVPRTETFRLVDDVVAVFPNYIFVDTEVFAPVLATRGVIGFITMGGEFVRMHDRIVERLRAIRYDDIAPKSLRRMSVGQDFEFAHGSPFAGLVGCVASVADLDKKGELRAWVDILGSRRNIKVQFDSIKVLDDSSRIAASAA